ncbi:hypothetical protein [Streptococcus mitis]|jgi:hypothetical protein|uniref:Uncharacterized protein n=1 Tax=Streptococcus mitis TaxID=28037 RepID=A0A6M9EY57_STRMT|nr:hypothetical protein [Streptococcus mitis]QKL32480.1 hypothetical protein M594_01685 [Streptococcus mitis]
MKKLVTKFMDIEWYYQLLISSVIFVLLALLIKFLVWIAPIFLVIFGLLIIYNEGEIIAFAWQRYKQRNQTSGNPLYEELYHWLTEKGVTELPISSLKFTQGVEADKPYTYFVHIDKEITDELLESFETKVRQVVKTLSNGSTDCVVSRSKREPFLAIKVRLVSADTMLVQKNQREEDF